MAVAYVELLNEGVPTWSPVNVEMLDQNVARLPEKAPSHEEWRFPPGSLVRLETHQFEGQPQPALRAVALADE